MFFHYSARMIVLIGFASIIHSPAFAQAQPSAKAGYGIYAHAHNDYEHERPLLDALDQNFHSVEADVWLVDGEILVSHDKGRYKGSLKDLYLDPLRERVNKNKTVHGDGEPFYLWLDIKDKQAELRTTLHALLENYSMLSIFSEADHQKNVTGPVTAILTGEDRSKRAYVDEFPIRRVCRDGNYYKPEDPAADNKWQWYALNWNKYIKWDGVEPMADDQYRILIDLLNDAHLKGRKVRFWSCPDNERYWTLALAVGIDQINTDKLEALNAFLKTYHPKSAEPASK